MSGVLALDIASVTGWAASSPGDITRPVLGYFRTTAASDDDEAYGPRYLRFAQNVEELIAVHQPQLLVFEAPLQRADAHGFNSGRVLLGLAAVCELVAEEHALPYVEANILTVRKHFCGSGRATKADVMQRCRVLGWSVPSHDAADAAAVFDYAVSIARSQRCLK